MLIVRPEFCVVCLGHGCPFPRTDVPNVQEHILVCICLFLLSNLANLFHQANVVSLFVVLTENVLTSAAAVIWFENSSLASLAHQAKGPNTPFPLWCYILLGQFCLRGRRSQTANHQSHPKRKPH